MWRLRFDITVDGAKECSRAQFRCLFARWLLVLGVLCILTRDARSQLPNSFSSELRRVASAKSWNPHFCNGNYQWLTDGRLLVWAGADPPRAQLLDPVTGKRDPLILFNRLVFSGCPPETGIRFFHLTPDGKSGVSFIGRFTGPNLLSRTLSLDGFNMSIHPLTRQFEWKLETSWEWNGRFRGWVTYGSFNNGRTSRVMAVAHSDVAHSQEPRIVEIEQPATPTWTNVDSNGTAHLVGVTGDGWGVLAPSPDFLAQHPIWARTHGMPISLIDIDKGSMAPTNYEIALPAGADVDDFVLSPNCEHVAWKLRFRKPRRIPGRTTLYATSEIWISDRNGARMRQLAYQAANFGNSQAGLHFLAWKDDQNVSFILDDTLYTYPAK